MKKPLIIISSIVGVILLVVIGIFVYIKVTFLTQNEIKDIIIKDTGLTSNDIYFESIDLEAKDNRYEVEFYYNNTEYEYKIDAKNGRIIYNNFKINNSNINENNNQSSNSNNSSKNSNTNTNNNVITLDEAKTIALNETGANESNVTFTETKSDYDDGRQVYDIEYIYNNYEYSYEIDAIAGEIISYQRENINQWVNIHWF